MDYSVRTGSVDELAATLHEFAADRGDRGESERAGDAEAAAEALERGAGAAYFDRVVYAEGAADRYSVRKLPRAGIEAELREHVDGWEHQGKPALAAEAREALGLLAQGAESVRVGHLVYEICG